MKDKKMTDLTYTQDKMFTTFYPESKDGELAWNEMAEKMNGVAKVMNCEANNVIANLRRYGYKVKKADKPDMSMDEILKELCL